MSVTKEQREGFSVGELVERGRLGDFHLMVADHGGTSYLNIHPNGNRYFDRRINVIFETPGHEWWLFGDDIDGGDHTLSGLIEYLQKIKAVNDKFAALRAKEVKL